MLVTHWSSLNGSGMHRVAASMAKAELTLGVDARILDPFDPKQFGWEIALDADIHVNHTHIPERIGKHSFRKSCTKPYKWAFPVHGTPELVFESSVRDAEANGLGSGTSFAHHQRGMQMADAVMAFVPRHRDLYDLATDKHTVIDLIPMGMDTAFWSTGASLGKYDGKPSFMNCDNQYPFKWGVELIRMWPWIREELDEACLWVANLPGGLQRFVDVLAARYGSVYGSYIGSWSYSHENLRNILKSVDYYVSTVRYGDFNRISLEASASGCKVISCVGNEYADFWVPEGDQRRVAAELIRIGKGEVEPRQKLPVPTEEEMAHATIAVYERVLDRPRTNWALGGLPDALSITMRHAIADTHGSPGNPPPVLTIKPELSLMADEEAVA